MYLARDVSVFLQNAFNGMKAIRATDSWTAQLLFHARQPVFGGVFISSATKFTKSVVVAAVLATIGLLSVSKEAGEGARPTQFTAGLAVLVRRCVSACAPASSAGAWQ